MKPGKKQGERLFPFSLKSGVQVGSAEDRGSDRTPAVLSEGTASCPPVYYALKGGQAKPF